VARELGGTRCLLVADQGMVDAGYVQEATRTLKARRIDVFGFHDFQVNPTTAMVEAGRAFAATLEVNLIVGLGGGSSMDCAKGINFVLTNGGNMRDYWGYAKVDGLRQGHQLRAHQRRQYARLLGLRESVARDAADDRGADDGGDGK
jgi:alcohol dehydrogenase